MSTAIDPSDSSESLGFPELTALGKQIEVLRIGRGMSKQHLARYAGTSRQQLWRVMTGKTELTGALRSRLAEVLRVSEALLDVEQGPATSTTSTAPSALEFHVVDSPSWDPIAMDAYLAEPARVEQTLRTLPNGEAGRELKRVLLNSLEDCALERGVALAREFFDLRRRVIAGEL
jgi:transcriptional regulator with XRE-family HTH domain